MIAVNVVLKPVLGKNGELGESLKGFTEYRRQVLGDRTGLQETVWAADGNNFSTITLYESIGEAGEARSKMYVDQESLAFIGKITRLIREPASWSLWDVIVQPPEPGPSKFVLRVRVQSAVGKNTDVRRVLTEWCEYNHGRGNGIALSEEVWGARGGRFSVRVPFNSLAEAEASRNETSADPKYRQLVADLGTLMAGPASWEMSETIISAMRSEMTNGARAAARA